MGIYSCFLIVFYVFQKFFNKNINKLTKVEKYSIALISINLFIFIFMPTKIAIIHVSIIALYLIIFFSSKKNFVLFLVLFNFFQWFVAYNVIDIKYKNDDVCKQIQAVSATFNFYIKKGEFFDMKKSLKIVECKSKYFGNRADQYKNGKPMKKIY